MAMQVQPLWSVFLASRSGREFSYSTASAIKKKKWRWKCSPGSDAALGMGISKGQIQTCPPDYSLVTCILMIPGSRLGSWLIPPEMLAQVSLPKVQGLDDTVAIPGPLCISMVCLLAHRAKSLLLCLPLSWSTSAGFPGRTQRHKKSHNPSNLLTHHKYVFSLLRLHLAAQTHEHQDLFLVFGFCC